MIVGVFDSRKIKPMGGFGSGGHRRGAGRKPKERPFRLIDGGADRRGGGEPPELPPDPPLPVDPPADLSEASLAIWREWAPQACAAGTLIPTTRDAFGELCRLAVECRELHARFQVHVGGDGQPRALLRMSFKEEMATRRLYLNLSKEMHLRMKDFRLAPFGKELVPAGGATAPADPLAEFAGA